MNAFWIVGIVASVVMAGLVTWWVLSSMRAGRQNNPDKRSRD
jgi:hypothetical protein